MFSGCSAVGSVPGLGPGCRRFESCHPDENPLAHKVSGCSAVGSVPGLGPGCRRFESCHPDENPLAHKVNGFFVL